jgi:hypothetical protein
MPPKEKWMVFIFHQPRCGTENFCGSQYHLFPFPRYFKKNATLFSMKSFLFRPYSNSTIPQNILLQDEQPTTCFDISKDKM